MNKMVVLICSGAIAAAGVFYLSRISPSPRPQSTQGAIGAGSVPAVASICVQPVQNYAKRALDMEGVDAALVSELQTAGLPAAPTPAASGGCSAFVYTEITDVGGRGRKHAHVEFRLVLKDEVPPRLSSTAGGKSTPTPPSRDTVASIARAGHSFVVSRPAAPAESVIEREAIVTAFAEQARQIAAAYASAASSRASLQ